MFSSPPSLFVVYNGSPNKTQQIQLSVSFLLYFLFSIRFFFSTKKNNYVLVVYRITFAYNVSSQPLLNTVSYIVLHSNLWHRLKTVQGKLKKGFSCFLLRVGHRQLFHGKYLQNCISNLNYLHRRPRQKQDTPLDCGGGGVSSAVHSRRTSGHDN